MMTSRSVTRFGWLVLALGLPAAALASGGSRAPEPEATPQASPELQASEHYNAGIDDRDRAWKLRRKLDDPSLGPEKREKVERDIRSAYERAIEEFTAATMLRPDYHQAFGSLGYSQRQLGNYQAALQAYHKALSLNPDYVEALEYLGEAYLGLNRVDEAQDTWDQLQLRDSRLAAELLGAMRAWVDQRRDDPAGVKVGQLDALERWIDERADGSPPPAASSLGKSRSW